jgi:hypothetical protein
VWLGLSHSARSGVRTQQIAQVPGVSKEEEIAYRVLVIELLPASIAIDARSILLSGSNVSHQRKVTLSQQPEWLAILH